MRQSHLLRVQFLRGDVNVAPPKIFEMISQGAKIQAVRMLQNQATVLLLPFIRGEGGDEGLLQRVVH